jgi:hypothetical protein
MFLQASNQEFPSSNGVNPTLFIRRRIGVISAGIIDFIRRIPPRPCRDSSAFWKTAFAFCFGLHGPDGADLWGEFWEEVGSGYDFG